MREARAFTAAVHAAQERDGLGLSQHVFVQSVRAGSASRDELGQWVRQIYCTTRSYGATLLSLSPPPPVGVWVDPWRDLELLLELGGALGISPRELRSCEPNLIARGVQLWLRHHLTDPRRHVAAQISWAMVEAMSPEAGAEPGGRPLAALRTEREATRIFPHRYEVQAASGQLRGHAAEPDRD